MDMGCIVQEVAQSPFALYLVRATGTHTYIGFRKERIASLVGKLQDVVQSIGSLYLSRRADTSGSIILLHLRFLLDGVYLVRLDTGVNVKVGSQSGILLQPVLIIGLQEVDAAVLEDKEGFAYYEIKKIKVIYIEGIIFYYLLLKVEVVEMAVEKTMDKIVALCKNRGFVFPGSDIYGGLANSWDYGPIGSEMKKNIKDMWWKKFIHESKYNVGIDAAIIMNPEVWVAVVKQGKIMFEVAEVTEDVAREALRLASHKLPITTKFVTKESGEKNEG